MMEENEGYYIIKLRKDRVNKAKKCLLILVGVALLIAASYVPGIARKSTTDYAFSVCKTSGLDQYGNYTMYCHASNDTIYEMPSVLNKEIGFVHYWSFRVDPYWNFNW